MSRRVRTGGGASGVVRLIGGEWRGRRLPVIDSAGLRPSPDRLRETLFNWLAPLLPGASCLDLFAGSGALGLEAASRGAAGVTLVESDRLVVECLREQLTALGADARVELVAQDAMRFLHADQRRFDIVFVDPPFGEGLQAMVLDRLVTRHLAPDARVHVEMEARSAASVATPAGLEILREKRFGDVVARLLGTKDDV